MISIRVFAFLALFATFQTSFSLATLNVQPRCVLYNGRLFGKDLDVPCIHYTSNYADGRGVVDGTVEVVLSDPTAKPALELYSGELMNLPNDKCCPPETFVREIGCDMYMPQGSCCYDKENVYVSGLSHHIGCVHSVETYASYVPTGGAISWETENPEANYEVELYLSLMSDGCCGCYLHSLSCSSCDN